MNLHEFITIPTWWNNQIESGLITSITLFSGLNMISSLSIHVILAALYLIMVSELLQSAHLIQSSRPD